VHDLLIIVPSRERPHNAVRFLTALEAAGGGADVVFGVDWDDPTRDQYPPPVFPDRRRGMNGTLNHIAVANADHYRYLGFAGDDHRVRTPGAARTICDTLDRLGTGVCYGNDLIHGQGLPTAVFMTADIVRTLGYMAPPILKHLCMDDSWLALGQALDAIEYLPDVIIEHMHPLVGKAPSDVGYQRVNAAEIAEHDRAEFERWRRDDLPAAVEKIRAARG
jgi:hypothetical protein